MTKYRIPVRVVTPPVTDRRAPVSEENLRKVVPEEPANAFQHAEETALKAVSSAAAPEHGAVLPDTQEAASHTTETKEREHSYRSSEDQDEWRGRAMRLQAEMKAYRRRQRRIAHDEARAEQIMLLHDVLAIADDLDRALSAAQGRPKVQGPPDPLIQGVELTRSSLEHVLAKHSLEQIQAKGTPFDPAWHEAVHVVPAEAFEVEPGTVVEVLEAGYRRQGALFRPAKVVVAQ